MFLWKSSSAPSPKEPVLLQEQPHPSELYDEYPWPKLLRLCPQIIKVMYDRCMTGLSVATGPNRGMQIEKPSSLMTNSAELALPFRNLRCNCRQSHLKSIRIGHTSKNVHATFYSTRVSRPQQRTISEATPGEQ